MQALLKAINQIKVFYNDNYFIKNYYSTSYTKNCLIIYIVRPFRKPNLKITHTNILEARVMANVFKEMEFNVDIISYLHKRKLDYRKYDVIIGQGDGFAEAFTHKKKEAKAIYYATTAFFPYAAMAELQRLKRLKEEKGVMLRERRQEPTKDYSKLLKSMVFADALFVTGNKWTISTYQGVNDNIKRIDVSGFQVQTFDKFSRNLETARRRFLWIGGTGNIHKGLDLCLEAFSEIPECELYIAGLLDEDFASIYKEQIHSPNIHYLGFVDVFTEAFIKSCEACGFVIFPSCSEGEATSVITAMFTGLVPVVTVQTGIDVEDFGEIIKKLDIKDIRNKIRDLSLLPADILAERQKKSAEYASNNHTLMCYETLLKKELNNSLGLNIES